MVQDLVLGLGPAVLVLLQEVSAPGKLAQEHCWVVPEPCQSGAESNEGFANSVLQRTGGLFAWENPEDGAIRALCMDILGSLDVSRRGMTKVSYPLPFWCGHFLPSGHFSSHGPMPSTSPLTCAEEHKARGNADRPFCCQAEWKCQCGELPGCPLQLLWLRLLQYVVPAQYNGMLIPLSRCLQALAERQKRVGWKEEEEESGAMDSQEQGRSPSEWGLLVSRGLFLAVLELPLSHAGTALGDLRPVLCWCSCSPPSALCGALEV